ncbi:MAG TPA: hypothetical protein VGD71_39510 [Kribbella sp.]|jgi:hypothetical protein
MKVTDAARLLGGTANDVRRLIAEGKLTLVPGSQRLVYEIYVRELSRTWTRPDRARPRPASGPDGHVDTSAAAQILGLSVSRTRQFASSERLPAQRDTVGRYWFRPERLRLVRRAWQAAEDNGRR